MIRVQKPRKKGHGKHLSYYDFGRTTTYACQADPRFSYCSYIPEAYREDDDRRFPVLVVIHGTDRNICFYRERFVDFAEKHGCILLVPLFPAGITSPGDLSSYKLLKARELRYDLVLLAMLKELGTKYRVDAERFLLHGFSGGGHFAHRFMYLHPGRLAAVSIGAPGSITLLDFECDYWVGVRNLEQVFGIAANIDLLRQVIVQVVVGAEDTETWEITLNEQDDRWMPGADRAGRDRLERSNALRASLHGHGINVRYDRVAGVAHESSGIVSTVTDFFSSVLSSPPLD